MLLAGETVLRAVSKPVTRLLGKWSDGDKGLSRSLSPLVHDKLRRQARQYLRKEHTDHTSPGNALVHETYLRLRFANREHFLSIVAHACRRGATKRGGGHRPALKEVATPGTMRSGDRVLLEKVLQELARLNIRQSGSVELWLLAGPIAEVARVLRISAAPVKRDWATARLCLPATIRPGS